MKEPLFAERRRKLLDPHTLHLVREAVAKDPVGL